MKSFKSLSHKEKMEYIGIMAIYPLILLYEQIGKSFKFLNSRSRQITASILTVCLMLTMVPVMSLTAFAATGNDITSGGFATTEDMWNGSTTYNLIPDVTVPVTDSEGKLGTDSGEDIDRWRANWNNVMVPAGWGSDYITGYDDALQIYSITASDGSDTFAIRPAQTGTSGDNANLGGAGADVDDNMGGVSYTVELCAADMAYANVGALKTYAYGEFFREIDQSYHHTISFEFFDANGELIGSAFRYENTATTGAANGYLNRTSDEYDVPAGTKYVHFWYCNVGSGDARKSVRNMQAYLTNSLVHTDHTNFTEWAATGGTISASGKYYLADDFSGLTESVYIGNGSDACEVTLCLNGNTLDLGSYYLYVSKNATLNICDCSANETGKITGAGSYTVYTNYSTVNLHSSTVENTNSTGYAIYNSNGSANIAGGTVSAVKHGVYIYGTAITNISGGTVSATGSSARAVYISGAATTNITGGIISATGSYGYGVHNYSVNSVLKISGGRITSSKSYAVYNSYGTLFLSGTPIVSGNGVDIYNFTKYSYAKLYATATEDSNSAVYEGDTVSLGFTAAPGDTVVYNAKSTEKFSATPSLTLDENGIDLVYSPADAGYTVDAKQQMAYKQINGSEYDVVGNSGSGWLKTTYNNYGYNVAYSDLDDATVTCTPKFVNGGRYVQLNYTVTAGSSAITDGKLGVNADIQIGANDKAKVEVVKDGDTVVGLKMADTNSSNSSYGAQFNLFFGGPGATQADTYWFGYYYSRFTNQYNQLTEDTKSSSGTYAADLSTFSGDDSGFAISWQNINLAAGESATYSILVGVGTSVQAPVLASLIPEAATNKVDFTATVTNVEDSIIELFYNADGGEEVTLGTKTVGSTGSVEFSDTINCFNLPEGKHTLTFWAVNDAGAMSGSKTCTVTVEHNHEGEVFTEWTATSGELTSGNYYLTESNDEALTDNIRIPTGETVTLCLNGKTLDLGSKKIYVYGTLMICDCQASEGTITSSSSANGTISCYGKVLLSGGNIVNTSTEKSVGINVDGNSSAYAEAVITGGTVKAGTYGVQDWDGYAVISVSGGKIISETGYCLLNKRPIYISGNPTLVSGDNCADIYVEDPNLYAVSEDGTASYTGDSIITIEFYAPIYHKDKIIVNNVNTANKDKFTVTNEGYSLTLVDDDLVLHKHSWSSKWTSDGSAHWHDCTASNCNITENSQKNGYETHTAPVDDGNCTTAVKCPTCQYVFTAAKSHSFTTKASASLASAANCQHKAKYYVQCDNCDVVSSTLTIEVGGLGNHTWDTEWSKDENNHWHKCLISGCTEIKDNAKHFSDKEENKATYTKKPVCDVCGKEYGEKLVDSIAPTGEIKIKNNGWLQFWNTVTFGVFCKDYVEITITGADAQTDVKSIEYYLSDTAISDTEIGNVTGWQTYTDKINITANDKRFVYAKITDNAGNVTYLSVNGGIVVYTDSETDTESVTHILTTNTDKDVNVTLNGNTIKSVSLGATPLTLGTDYTVSGGKITLKADYLNTLSADTHTFTVEYNPQGVEYVEADGNDEPATTTFKVAVEKQKVTPPTIDGKVYTGETLTADVSDTDDYTVTTNLGGKNVAAYDVVLTLKDGANYKWDATEGVDGDKITLKFNITKATNEWTENPAMAGWTYGETVKSPTGKAKFIEGNYGIAYYDKDKNPIGNPSDAGDYFAQIFVADTTNFTGLTSDYLPFTIKKAPLTITANPHTITYGDAPDNAGVEYSGFVNGEGKYVLDGTLSYDYSYAQYDDIGDNFTITPKGLTAANYEITFVPGKLTVNSLETEIEWSTLSVGDLVYDGNANTLTATVKNKQNGDDVAFEIDLAGNNVNVTADGFYYTVTGLTGDKAGNYKLGSALQSPTYKVTKADPTVTWPNTLVGNAGDKLSTVALESGFTWDNADTVIVYSDNNYGMTYTPADTVNYNILKKDIKVNGLDVTFPTGEITLKDNKWNEFLNNITFGLFFKETQSITITAADTESGVKEIAYYLATEELSIEDVEALDGSKWTVYTDAFNVEPDNKYVVYARITDNAGNVIYINSDGIVLDSIKPVIAGVEDGKDIYGDATFTIQEEYLDTVTLDGEPIEVKDGKYSVPADNEEHTIVVTDKTGNTVTYKLTVYKNYKVSFVVDGKEISSSEVGNGKDANLPEIPGKDGYTAKWDVDGKNITTDTVITAVYEKIPQSPQTGDNTNIWLWLAVMFLSGLSIFGIVITKKRKEEEAE